MSIGRNGSLRWIGAAAVIWVAAQVTAAAQEKPDFSGTWALVAPAQPPAQGTPPPAGVLGPKMTIKQDAQALTIVRTSGGSAVAMTVPFDGSEARVHLPARLCEGGQVAIYTLGWDGAAAKLSLTGTVPPGGGTVFKRESVYLLKMETPDTLTVQLTSPAPNQAAPRVITSSYRKSTDAPVELAAPFPGQRATATIAQVSWLPGVWIGMTAGGRIAEERWTPSAGGSMLAVARTIHSEIMTGFEFLCIVERDGGLVYQAMPNGRQPATDFVLTSLTDDTATFENPTHDFPKKIQYVRKADGSMEAIVSGAPNQKPQVFQFKKQ
jgi:hypothetical protein